MAKAKRNRVQLSETEKKEVRELYAHDRVKYTKYKLAMMYGVTWKQVHYAIDEEARRRNIELTNKRKKEKQ